MGISLLIGPLMVQAVSGCPHQRGALAGRHGTEQDTELGRLRQLKGSMGQIAVVTQADADARRQPVHDDCDAKSLPAEEERGGQAPT